MLFNGVSAFFFTGVGLFNAHQFCYHFTVRVSLLACLSVLTKRGVLCKSNKRGVLLSGMGQRKKQMFEEYGKRRTMAGMG
jgi:hypothetical protein